MSDISSSILDFWFGPLDSSGSCSDDNKARWYKKDPEFDQSIKDKFEPLFRDLTRHAPRPSWVEGPQGLLAGVIVLDQFSRNMFRDSKEMYSGDGQALRLSFEIIALGYDKRLPLSLRPFSYMPLMHAENLPCQERCVELFSSFAEEQSGDTKKSVEFMGKYAVSHRDIVARFGRFPHRNQIVERESTREEIVFLKEPGSSF